MSKMITGSLCLTDILAKAKEGHSAFSRSEKNGKIYFNILQWENDEPDQFNNNFSVQLNPKKDAPETEKKQYIGNLKYVSSNVAAVQPVDLPSDDEMEKLPF